MPTPKNKLDGNGQSHSWNVHNGRKFGLRYGRKGGKARWASMTQEEKDIYWAKNHYAREQTAKMKARLSKTSLVPPKSTFTAQELEDIDKFFGDII